MYYIFVCFFIFRPLLKLVDRLLLVGMLRDEDVEKLLIMIHPETWDPTFEKGKLYIIMYLLKNENNADYNFFNTNLQMLFFTFIYTFLF